MVDKEYLLLGTCRSYSLYSFRETQLVDGMGLFVRHGLDRDCQRHRHGPRLVGRTLPTSRRNKNVGYRPRRFCY